MAATVPVRYRDEAKREYSVKLDIDYFVNIDSPEDIKRMHKRIPYIICTDFA